MDCRCSSHSTRQVESTPSPRRTTPANPPPHGSITSIPHPRNPSTSRVPTTILVTDLYPPFSLDPYAPQASFSARRSIAVAGANCPVGSAGIQTA